MEFLKDFIEPYLINEKVLDQIPSDKIFYDEAMGEDAYYLFYFDKKYKIIRVELGEK